MNHSEHALRRLLKSARRPAMESPAAMPFALEARILAQWRRGQTEDVSALLAGLFQRAVILGGLIMGLSIGWSQFSATREVPGAAALAKLEEVIQVVP